MKIGLGIGLSNGLSGSAGAPATFDPATLSLAGWWRASYGGSPWSPTDSAGTSGANGDLSEATDPPAVGAAVNGYTPAVANGSSSILTSANALTSYVGLGAGTVILLFKANSAVAAASPAYTNPCIIGRNGSPTLCAYYNTNGLGAIIYDGVDFNDTTATAAPTGAWHMGMIRWDSSTLECSVNAGTPKSVASGAISSPSFLRFFTNFANAAFFDGQLLECMTMTSAISDANVANVKNYFNARYALSL